jgi:hypothetical protein
VRFVEAYQPGIVECQFRDADGQTHSIVGKMPCFTAADLWFDSEYPQNAFEVEAMYKELSVWDRAEEGLYRYRILENVITTKFSVLMRDDYVGVQQAIPVDVLHKFDKYFVELLLDRSPEEKSGSFDTISEAITAFDKQFSTPTSTNAR